MRSLYTALLVGIAATAVGLCGAARAQNADLHLMTVRLPDGAVAQIQYTGNVPPRISLGDRPAVGEVVAPLPLFSAPASPFAMMDRISAEMDRQMAAMFRQADALGNAARPGPLSTAAVGQLPAGGQGYSFISTMSSNGVCSQSVEITSPGNGAPPRIVRHSSGNCGPSGGAAGSVALPTAPAPSVRPDVVWTSAEGAKPYAGLVREIPAAQR